MLVTAAAAAAAAHAEPKAHMDTYALQHLTTQTYITVTAHYCTACFKLRVSYTQYTYYSTAPYKTCPRHKRSEHYHLTCSVCDSGCVTHYYYYCYCCTCCGARECVERLLLLECVQIVLHMFEPCACVYLCSYYDHTDTLCY
jgi:hypothetical protein